MNTICLLLCVSHWPIIMIRPGGLPLEVSHLFAVSVLVSSTGLERKKITKFGCEKYFYWAAY
jgi:hypothetical protein